MSRLTKKNNQGTGSWTQFGDEYKNHHKESFDQEIYDLLKARLDKEVLGNAK